MYRKSSEVVNDVLITSVDVVYSTTWIHDRCDRGLHSSLVMLLLTYCLINKMNIVKSTPSRAFAPQVVMTRTLLIKQPGMLKNIIKLSLFQV